MTNPIQKPEQCTVTFRVGKMRKSVQCTLREGHRGVRHEHKSPTWTAVAWPRKAGGLHFRFMAHNGKSLPGYLL